jgi:hypothetical protein
MLLYYSEVLFKLSAQFCSTILLPQLSHRQCENRSRNFSIGKKIKQFIRAVFSRSNMLFWLGNSVVALLFLVLMDLGLRRRAWMFALMNFIGMALDAAIVLIDIFGHLNVTILLFAMPALAFVIATEVTRYFANRARIQRRRPASKRRRQSARCRIF